MIPPDSEISRRTSCQDAFYFCAMKVNKVDAARLRRVSSRMQERPCRAFRRATATGAISRAHADAAI